MKSVLISIQPKWVSKICNKIGDRDGKSLYEKTVEVRKTKPKIDVPFKCYIYCTKGKDLLTISNGKVNKPNEIVIDLTNDRPIYELNSNVIGEFVCDRIDEFSVPYPAYFSEVDSKTESIIKSACLRPMDIHHYNGTRQTYAWHISDLVIYDKPKELWNFKKECVGYVRNDEDCCFETCPEFDLGGCDGRYKPIYTPPMSWGYIEDLGV